MGETKQLQITEMGAQGEGVAVRDGTRIFVPYALPGEAVQASIEGNRATLENLEAASPDRVTPPCPHFGICGGCQTQHWAEQPYRAWKRGLVVDALERAGLKVTVADLVPAHGAGRRRATLHATPGAAGFNVRRSHEIHPIDTCPILVDALSDAPRIAREAAKLAGPCDVGFTATDTGLDVAIRTSDKKPPRADYAPLANRFKLARVSVNGETMVQRQRPAITMGKARVDLPVDTFLQATRKAEDVLGELVIEATQGARRVVDLFCGTGPFALRLAAHHQTYAVDGDRAAVAACSAAMKATPGLRTLGTEVRDLFRDPLLPAELTRFDTAVFDPPRAGAQAQVRELAQSKIKRIVGVSCDPVSFARDASILTDAGFRLMHVTPVDQFLYSPHVELVARFKR